MPGRAQSRTLYNWGVTALRDLKGQTFGRLTVAGPHRRIGDKTAWPCRCECGAEVEVRSGDLTSGKAKSCGCFRRERASEERTTHGLGKPPEYNVWHKMRRRCEDPENIDYAYYGGRGITVCERWLAFENFYADMGPRPTPDHQIDRIDNSGNYEPANCHWTTRIVNCNNRRDNVQIEWNGESLTIPEWARRTGLKEDAIYQRINKLGWPVQRALTTPVRMRRAPAKASQ